MPNVITNFAADQFVQGGLLSDVDVEIKAAQFVAWDYNGTLPEANILALKLTMNVLGDDAEHEEYLSAGKIADFWPNPADDGNTLESEAKSALNKGSNFFLFVESLNAAGAPASLLAKGVSGLVGCHFHIERKAAPKREGGSFIRKEGREATFLAVTKVVKLAGEKAKGKTAAGAKAAAPKAAAAAKPAAAADGDAPELNEALTDRAMGVVTDILSDSDGTAKIESLKVTGFRKMAKDPAAERGEILRAITNADWLTANGFTVEGGMVSMG